MGSKTRAKFKCTSIEKSLAGDGFVFNAKLEPVYSGSPENEAFWKATPGGSIQLFTIKGDHFEVGKEYYVDFIASS